MGSGKYNGMHHAIADRPEGPFTPAGPLVSLGNARYHGQATPTDHVGNTHGGMFQADGQWYQIYHRHTKSGRSACAVPLTRRADGGFEHAEHTSMGFSQHPLEAFHRWPAYMACHLTDRKGGTGKGAPVIVQRDYPCTDGELPVVSSLQAGSIVGYKYFDFGADDNAGSQVSIEVNPAGTGKVDVVLDDPNSAPVATIQVAAPGRQMGDLHSPHVRGERRPRGLPGTAAGGARARGAVSPDVRSGRLTQLLRRWSPSGTKLVRPDQDVGWNRCRRRARREWSPPSGPAPVGSSCEGLLGPQW